MCSRAQLPNCTGEAWCLPPRKHGGGAGQTHAFSALSLLKAFGVCSPRAGVTGDSEEDQCAGTGSGGYNILPYWQVWTVAGARQPLLPTPATSRPATSANDSEQQSLSSDADSLSPPTAACGCPPLWAAPRELLLEASCGDHSLGGFLQARRRAALVVPSPGLVPVCAVRPERATPRHLLCACLPCDLEAVSPDWQGLSSLGVALCRAGWGPRRWQNPVQGCLPWGKCSLLTPFSLVLPMTLGTLGAGQDVMVLHLPMSHQGMACLLGPNSTAYVHQACLRSVTHHLLSLCPRQGGSGLEPAGGWASTPAMAHGLRP